jgi:hypothetical protein
VTFTGNPKWPEIVGALQKGQLYQHRPDIVCQIFMDKVDELMKDILSRHVLGKVASWCYSVEHQKRGFSTVYQFFFYFLYFKECLISIFS